MQWLPELEIDDDRRTGTYVMATTIAAEKISLPK